MSFFKSDCFILRRSFWNGRVCRHDVELAFDVSPATAGRWLAHACDNYSDCLDRLPRQVRPRLQANVPPVARAEEFFQLLSRGKAHFSELGLKPSEISIAYASLHSTHPPDEAIAGHLIKALRHTLPVDIRYVGLKHGATGQWRTVIPVSLEMFQGQWRIYAHDLSDEGKLKTFVLNRLLSVKRSDAKAPRGLIIQTGEQRRSRYRVFFNDLLTQDQRYVLRHEMRLEEGDWVSLSVSEEFEFRRQYTDTQIKAQHNIVWPLVARLDSPGN